MAAPIYTTDLTLVTEATATTAWSEPGVTTPSYQEGGGATAETDYFIQGTGCLSQQTTKVGLAALIFSSSTISNGPIVVPTDGAVLIWQYMGAPNAITTYVSGGMRVILGTTTTGFSTWFVGGEDISPYPYGGWMNHAVNPAISASTTVGASSSAWNYVGASVNIDNAVGKGNPHGIDVIRYGRAQLRIESGALATPATFSGSAAVNDSGSNRWGLLQKVGGGYQLKGSLRIGHSASCYFADSNTNVTIQFTPKVTRNFNIIEISNPLTTFTLSNVAFSSLNTDTLETSPSGSRGRFRMLTEATVSLDTCTFTDMDDFIFSSSAITNNCTWRRCYEVYANGAKFTNGVFDSSVVATNSSSLHWNTNLDPDGYLDNASFIKGTNAHHAIAFSTSTPTNMTVRGATFTGFNATSESNDSALHVLRTTGNVTISLADCVGTITYKSEGALVKLVTNTVTHTLTGLISGSEVAYVLTGSTDVVYAMESAPISGVSTYTYEYTGDRHVNIYIASVNYEWQSINNVTLGATDATIPVQQRFDRNYNNPLP